MASSELIQIQHGKGCGEMDFEQIKELISLVDATAITDLEIRDGEFCLRLRKREAVPAAGPGQRQEVGGLLAAAEPASRSGAQAPAAAPGDPSSLVEVCAPMVGTFYRAPAPAAPPYVDVGDVIVPGQVLFIIEAMKMMNEIEAEVQGVVRQILVESGEPVEYGQPVLLVEPKE